MRNGMRHTAAVTTTFKNRYFSLNPEVRITDRMYFEQLRKTVFRCGHHLHRHGYRAQIRGTVRVEHGRHLTSKVYGMYTFRGKGVRHPPRDHAHRWLQLPARQQHTDRRTFRCERCHRQLLARSTSASTANPRSGESGTVNLGPDPEPRGEGARPEGHAGQRRRSSTPSN
jgi:hypothetical protein